MLLMKHAAVVALWVWASPIKLCTKCQARFGTKGLFGRAPSDSDSMGADSLREVILWLKVILFDSLA